MSLDRPEHVCRPHEDVGVVRQLQQADADRGEPEEEAAGDVEPAGADEAAAAQLRRDGGEEERGQAGQADGQTVLRDAI